MGKKDERNNFISDDYFDYFRLEPLAIIVQMKMRILDEHTPEEMRIKPEPLNEQE